MPTFNPFTGNIDFKGTASAGGSGDALTSGTLAQFAATTSAELAGVISNETGTGLLVFATSPVLTTPTVTTKISPTSDDGAPLGDTTHNFSDLFLASGGVVNFNNSDVTITHATDSLTFGGHTLGTGFINVGAPTTIAMFNVGAATTNLAYFTNTATSGSAAGAGMIGYSDDGAALSSGDRLGFFLFGGSKDNAHTLGNATGLTAFTAEAWSGTATGAELRFETTANTTTSRTVKMTLANDGALKLVGKVGQYNNVNTAGWGTPAIYGSGRSTGQTAAVGSVAAYTLPATDGSFIVSANLLVTTSSAEAFNVQVVYTDEGNTARTLNLPLAVLGGTTVSAVNFSNGAVPYSGMPVQIRCKASTAITIKTAGTFTGCTYNVEGMIQQVG